MLRSLLVVVFLLGGLLIPSRAALAEPPAGYPQLTFVPAAEGNYDVGRGGARITAIVIHETEAPYSSVVYWFRRPGSNASAHYLVRAWDGGITQFVAESDRAYHARSAARPRSPARSGTGTASLSTATTSSATTSCPGTTTATRGRSGTGPTTCPSSAPAPAMPT